MKIKLVKFAIFSFVTFFVLVSVVEAQSISILDKKMVICYHPTKPIMFITPLSTFMDFVMYLRNGFPTEKAYRI